MIRTAKHAPTGALLVAFLGIPFLGQAQYTGVAGSAGSGSAGNWDTTRPGGPGYQQGIHNATHAGGAPGIPASYDLKVGDVYLRAGAGVNFTYNDNVTLSSDDEQSDYIISPNARLGYYVPFTRENGMQFSIDCGADLYMNRDEYNHFALYPNGDNAFEIYGEADNWSFRLRDSFHFFTSPLVNNTTSTGGNYVRQFQNVTTLTADADYDEFVTGLAYNHLLIKYWGNDYEYLDRQSDSFATYLGFRVMSPLILGVNAGCNYDYYDGGDLNNSFGVNGSAYAQFVLTRNISGGASVGWGWSDYDGGGRYDDSSDYSDIIFSFVLTHEVNKYFRHSINVFKNLQPGVTSNYQDTISLIYNCGWDLFRFWTVDLLYSYVYYDSSSSDVSESAGIHRLTLGHSWQLTKRVNLTARYTYQMKDSDLDVDSDWDEVNQDFSQNVFSVGLQYLF